jgi:hypothetical protein
LRKYAASIARLAKAPRYLYYADMSYFKDISPRRAVADLVAFVRADRPYKWFLMIAACVPPALIYATIAMDFKALNVGPPPTVTYFESWPADRSIEESKAAIAERQILKDAMLEQQRQRYKALGRASGMDVERIEREAFAKKTAATHAGAKP